MNENRKYLKKLQEREKILLTQTHQGRNVYCTQRDIVARLAQPFIGEIVENDRNLKILEVGCGDGKALIEILNNHPSLKPEQLSATSLTNLPAHRTIPAGIDLRIGIAAEQLSQVFNQKFNVVLASAVLQWTELDIALREIAKVVSTGGYFIGFDNRSTVSATIIKTSRQFRSIINSAEVEVFSQHGHGLIPFVLRKK